MTPVAKGHNGLLPKAREKVLQTDSVLVAEDDPVSLGLLASWLKKWGLHVTATKNGQEAWRELQKDGAAKLIILDWMMPGLSGVDLCRKIRAKKTACYPYILLLTSRSAKQDIVEGLDAGADDYITKPFDPDELMARLQVGGRMLELQEELRSRENELRFVADHDALTQLWSRGAILKFLDQEISRAMRGAGSLGIMMVDIDHFKRINDTHGHQAGDAVLRQVAELLGLGIRRYDWVGRYGGEEFLVVLPDCDVETVAICAERVRRMVASTPCRIENGMLPVTVSIGTAVRPCTSALSPDHLVASADGALYRAKNNGRDRVEMAGVPSPRFRTYTRRRPR